MIRNGIVVVSLAAALGVALQGCGSDTKLFKPNSDAAAGAGGSDSGSAGAKSSGGSAGASVKDGAPGDSGPVCGDIFTHAGKCQTCLEANCCALAVTCAGLPECSKLVGCIHACDDKTGTAGDQCVTACTDQFLTANSKAAYNPLVQCMGKPPCFDVCQYRGP